MNNLQELVNKHYKVNKHKKVSNIFDLIFFIILISNLLITLLLINKISNITRTIIYSVNTLICITNHLIRLNFTNKLKESTKQINDLVKKDSLTDYTKDTNRQWHKEVFAVENKERKKYLIVFLSCLTSSLAIFVPSLIHVIQVRKQPHTGFDIFVYILFYISILSTFLFLLLTISHTSLNYSSFFIHGYLVIVVTKIRGVNIYSNDINISSKKDIVEFTLPDGEPVIYVGGVIFPTKLIDKEGIK